MDHLQQAQYAIEATATATTHERAMLKTQMAIAKAMIALVERMDKMIEIHDLIHDQLAASN